MHVQLNFSDFLFSLRKTLGKTILLAWPIFKEDTYNCKDYGTLKRNVMPWLYVMKTVCVFYLVSLHISLSLTPTPFVSDREVTGVWVDDKFIITVVANKGNPWTFPGKRHLAVQSIRPHFTDWFIMVC
jgi:hypothetical protein